MTQDDWDSKWWEIYRALTSVGRTPLRAFEESNRRMERTFGPRPPAPKVAKDGESAGPPLWLKLLSPLAGVPMDFLNKLWAWFDGKKTIVGAVITALAWAATNAAVILPVLGVDAVLVAKIGGILLTVVGVLHKVYKFLYKEEHP